MRDGDYHLYSGIGTAGTVALMVVIGVLNAYGEQLGCAASPAHATADPYANMRVIDAALAEASKQPERQPQKKFKAPPPPDQPVGVATDVNAKPADKVDEPKDKPADPDTALDKYRRPDDDEDDVPVGKPTPIERGVIGGSEVGFGDKTFGDPYLGALKSQYLRLWEYPEILDEVGTPVGCIRLNEDGTIEDVKLATPSGNADLDTSVEKALADFMKKVNEAPKPVPPNLSDLTRIPLCWRMKV